MNLNFDAIDAFVVFSETCNFTHASEELHISQPSLHVKIKKLSEALGVPLYTKQGRKLVLTNFGIELARFGREARTHASDFVEQLIQGKKSQPVVLAAGAGSYLYILGDAIRSYKKKTEIPLRLLTANREQTLELVLTGQAQLGVTAFDSVPDNLQAKLLTTVPTVLVVPKHHVLAKRKSISISQLNGSELIVPSPDRPHREAISRMLDIHGVSWKVALEATGWELTIQFVKLGLGIAIVNGCCKVPKELRAIPVKEFPPTRYYLVTRQKIAVGSAQQLLYDQICSHIS
jgi:LysR family transcriptional regulator, low CO2-responsive transcriptional regulator